MLITLLSETSETLLTEIKQDKLPNCQTYYLLSLLKKIKKKLVVSRNS